MFQIKKILFTAAVVVACSPTFVSAQDFFFSFDENSLVTSQSIAETTSTGSLFIFNDAGIDFDQLDLDFTNSDSSVVAFTGGVVFNPGAPASGTAAEAPGGRFTSLSLADPNDLNAAITATDGRLFATSFLEAKPPPEVLMTSFRAGVNGFLLAKVDFDIVGEGTANFDFVLGDLGVVNDGTGELAPTFGRASLEVVAVPEPTSAVVLILGAAGMVARRRRS